MDLSDLRASIPACEGVYLNTGASGPSPRRVVDAVADATERQEYVAHREADPYDYAFEVFDEARAAVAGHLDAGERDVALTESTTDGIGRVAAAIDWEPGDAVVRTDLEHSAGILPWQRLEREHGIEVRVVETEAGHVPLDAYREAVEGARLATFSSVSWLHGTRLRVSELVGAAHDAGAEALVDAVQSVGQEPVDVGAWGAEYVAAAGHKWLLGPHGSGFLYVDPDAAVEVVPAQLGYRGVVEPDAERYELHPDARRFEVATAAPGPYAGLRAAIDAIEDVGLEAIRARSRELADRLKDGLGADRLVSPRGHESGLVAFETDEPEATVERLADRGIQLRALPPTGTVRASVHGFNTAADVDALLDAVGSS